MDPNSSPHHLAAYQAALSPNYSLLRFLLRPPQASRPRRLALRPALRRSSRDPRPPKAVFAADPAGYFHIVSKDSDFDSVIRHLKGETKLIVRHASLAEIPALRSPEERLARIKDELADDTKSRPRTRKTLENTIKSAFENNAEPGFIESTIKTLIQAGLLDFTETDTVLYKAA